MSGSVIGVVLITVLSEVLRNAERGVNLGVIQVPPIYGASQVVMAVLFVLVIVFRPAGILGGREIDFRALVRRIFPDHTRESKDH